jgi:hypothetical protein
MLGRFTVHWWPQAMGSAPYDLFGLQEAAYLRSSSEPLAGFSPSPEVESPNIVVAISAQLYISQRPTL